MTDKEIINNIERCIENDCDNCTWMEQTACKEYMLHDALDLINRQQAEIERLKAEHKKTTAYCANLFDKYEKTKIAKESLENTRYTTRAEAIKEFADKLKNYHYKSSSNWQV